MNRAKPKPKIKPKSGHAPATIWENRHRWYVIQLAPQLLETARYNLKNQNFELFCPRIEVKNGKSTTVELMFRGYGFVNFNAVTDNWAAINGTRGVTALMPAHSLYPSPVPDGLVEGLKAHDPSKYDDFEKVFVEFFPETKEYFPGDEVDVDQTHRLLGGRKGQVSSVRNKLLQISFGGTTSVWLDSDYVTLARSRIDG